MDEQVKNLITELCAGNPGALRVCIELFQHFGQEPLQLLKDQNITGGNIWLLFKDVNGGDDLELFAYNSMFDDLQDGSAAEKVKATGYSTL